MMRLLALILALLPSLALAGPLVIGPDTKVNNTYRWLDGKIRDLNGMVFDGRNVTVQRNVIRIWTDDSNTTIRNSTFTLLKPTVNPGDLPVAVEFIGGHDHLVENVIAENFRSEPREKHYENGDCFSGEREASRITFRNTRASNCSDGGYDFKSVDVRFENATAEDAGKGFRIWGTATASVITCRRWRFACLQTNPGAPGMPASFVVDKLIFEQNPDSKAYIFDVWPGSTLTVKSCSGKLGDGKVIFWQKGATPENTNVTLCGVKVTNQTEPQLRAEIEAKIAGKATAVTAPVTVAALPKPKNMPLCSFPTKLVDRNGDGVITLSGANAETCGGTAGLRVKLVDEKPRQYTYKAVR